MAVNHNILVPTPHELHFNGKIYRCAIGKGGFTDRKKEGDHKTPRGEYSLRECWYRSDRLRAPETVLPRRIITPNDGWCDASEDAEYNHHVILPYAASHETLWRKDHAYDVIVPLGYNDAPVVPGRGSAIFLHVAQPNYAGTEGCVALALPDLLEVLKKVTLETKIKIGSE